MPCWTRWGSTTTNWPIISPNAHRHHHHHHHHHPRLREGRREGAVDPRPEAETGDAAGCHPEGVAGTTTMEARLAGVAAAVEGDVVAVAVGVGVAAAHPLDERA